MSRVPKAVVVGLGALVLTTVAISASDVVQNVRGNLSGLVIDSTTGPCQPGAVLAQLQDKTLCVDVYEASAGEQCPVRVPLNEIESRTNIDSSTCFTASVRDVLPWRFVSQNEAQQLCARTSKRLLTSDEWYALVSGLTDMSGCHIDSQANEVRVTSDTCKAPSGVSDLVGNVWEWLNEQVVDGVIAGRALPSSGYVTAVDTLGIALATGDQADSTYGNDYALTSASGVKGLIRGGFFGSGNDAGIYGINASVNLDVRTTGIGFRCVQDIYQ